MKYKNIMIITLLIIMFTITAVSASEDNSTDDTLTISEDVDDVKIESGENDVIEAGNGGDAVLGKSDYASTELIGNGSSSHGFDELQTLIDSTAGDAITLQHDYVGTGSRIVISKAITINGDGHKLDAKSLSSILYVNSFPCTLANLILCNAKTDIEAAITFSSGNFKLENCMIENITGEYPAISLDGSVIMNNVDINNVSTTSDGGAITILGSNCLIANTSFTDCSANNGGCIYVYGMSSQIVNCTFSNSSSTCHGAAIYYNIAGILSNSTFYNCSAMGKGGSIYVSPDSVMIDGCSFLDSTSQNEGGAIYWLGSDGALSNSIFENCSSLSNNGGAVYWEGENGLIRYSNFTNNSALSGGTIYVKGALGGMTISSCSFINSNASDGGAICWNGDDGELKNCNFTGCVVDNGGGGAISWDGLNGLVKNCVFYNCSASFSGGAIYWSGGKGAIENSTFLNGQAYDGGAVYCIDASVSDCTFIRCSSSENGGAVYFEENSSSITNSIFIQNYAHTDGGAVYGVGNNVSHSQFIENNASDKGGAIYNCTYVNCNFTGNSNPEIYPQKETLININASNIFVGQEATIIVSLPEDINSNITITVGGANYPPVDIKNGTAILHIANLTAGNYTVTALFNGTAEYSPNSNSTYFTVSKNTPSIDAVPDKTEYYVGDNVDLTVTFKSDVDAVTIVVYDINGTIVWQNNVTRISGELHVNIPCTTVGFFTVQAIFKGDDYYLPCDFLENNFTVFKKPTIMNVTISDASVGDNVTAYLYLPDDATGIIDVYVAGKYYGNVGVVNGEASVLIPCTSVGTFELKASYRGDDKYEDCNSSESFTISKGKFPISVTANDCTVGQNLIVNITIPSKINCTVTLRLIGNGGNENMSVPGYGPYTVDIINGKGSKTIYADKVGLFNVSVNFEANDNYQSSVNNTVKVRVNSSDIIIVPEKVNLTVNTVENTDEGYIQVTVPTDITKTLTLTINGNVYTINHGGRKIDLTYLNTGNYTYIINYPGDDKYKSYNSNGSIYLTKTTPELNITVKDTTYGQGGNITVLISDDITGAVNFTLLNEDDSLVDNQIVNVANGAAVYMIPELNVGKYKLNAQATGDSKYYKSSLYSASFNVAPKISITPDVIIGDDGIITMELGNVSGVIAVSVDGELDGSKRIADGKFIYALSTWVLLVGNHTLTFQYSGNSFDKNVFNYWDNETSTYKPIEYKFHIAPKQTETKSDSDNDNLLEIQLEDEKGNALSNATGKIEFEIINQFTKEVQKVVVDVVNGIAVLDISQFKDGDYLITWNYLGDDKHTPISKQLSLKITHKASRISAGDLTVLYTLTGRYSVTVYASSGEAMSGVPVTFLINNRIVKTVTTDSRGVASIPVSGNPGSYRITVRADSLSVTRTLTVTHLLSLKTVKVKSSAKKLVLTASLKKVNGKYLKGKKITFKFNGKAYSAKTNKKGVAKVTLKSKVLKKLKAGKKVTYQATYLKDTVKKSVKVKD